MSGVSYRQGFAWWAFADSGIQPEALLSAAAEIGYQAIDFLPDDHWAAAARCGLTVSIIDGHKSLETGFNNRRNHAVLSTETRGAIARAAEAGVPFVAVAPGDRSEDARDGMESCAAALSPLAEEANAAGVCLLMEPLNSKVDHPGHECDLTSWGAELIDRVDSPGLRLLYDFYHAQIMEGDLVRTVETHLHRIAHLHTAGVPGRHELNDEQEINWRGVANHLNRLGYDGIVSHELIPQADPVDALRAAFALFA